MGFTAADIKTVVERYRDRLEEYREALNGLNVYPVPDGDTGTNMALTMTSVTTATAAASSMGELADAMAHGSLMGARGNSGVILSQILRGMSEVIREAGEVDTLVWGRALTNASAAAYRSVGSPVEGTILTVLREAAEATAALDHATPLAECLDLVYRQAISTLARTPEMLPVLRQAGVVDAGAAGFLLLLACFAEVGTGREVEIPDRLLTGRPNLAAVGTITGPGSRRYEVMFFLDAPDDRVEEFKTSWSGLGDSIVVVGGDGVWNCHVHTDDIGGAIEAGIKVGRPRVIRVTDLKEQTGEHGGVVSFEPAATAREAQIGVVTVAVGSGIVDIFKQLGVQGVVAGGQTMNPSTGDLLEVVDRVPAGTVIVLPNNRNIVPVAEQLDALTTKDVVVVPTRSVQQGIAALFGYDPGTTDLAGTIEDMAAAASSVVDGEVTRAVRDATVAFGRIKQGDWIGVADGSIVVADTDLETTLRGLVAAILPQGSELITVYAGSGSSPATTKSLVAWMSELYPDLEVNVVDGGQPLYPYLVSIE